MDNSLKYLIELTKKKKYDDIKNYLSDLQTNKDKGKIFEEYMRELFEGNGWIATRKGGRNDFGADVLLSHPKTPHLVSLIIQAKNQNTSLTYDDTKIEINKFEEQGSKKYKCNHFTIISLNGFVKNTSKLKEYANLESFDYVKKLIDGYDPTNKKVPEFELLPHNKIAYLKTKEVLKKSDKVSVVQPTGTGKSFIITSVLSDYLTENKIVLAPSKFILDNLKEKAFWAIKNTTFMTYAKALKLKEDEIKKISPSLIVLDEFHRVGAEKWSGAVKKILDFNPNAKTVGASATPIRYLDNGRDMSIELFGKENIASNMALTEAIAKKILPMPKYIASLYTIKEEIDNTKDKIKKSENTQKEKENLLKELNDIDLSWEKTNGVPEIIKKHITKDKKKFIVFCKDKNHLSDMEVIVEKWFKDAGYKEKINKYRVISGDSTYKEELESFKENKRISLLFCIDMLNEGLHIQDVDVAFLLRPTISGNIFYQQIGRVLDVSKKTEPIIIDLVNNFSSIEVNNLYENLESAVSKENQKRDKLGLNKVDIPITIFDETKDVQELLDSLQSKLNTSWDSMLQELIKFKDTHKHLDIPKRLKGVNNLGYWVQTQRQMHKQNNLSKERIDKLNSIGFIWDTLEGKWEEKFSELKAYIKENGNMNFTKKLQKESGLPNWCFDQKKRYNQGKLAKERIDKLNSIGFVWDSWQTFYNELKEFFTENGHSNVPTSYKGKSNLRSWISDQRKSYNKNNLSKEKIELLKKIDFVFEVKSNNWDKKFEELKNYWKETGSSTPSKGEVSNELYNWISNQRNSYKNKTLTDEKIEKLNSINFVSEVLEHNWEEMFSELKDYYKNNKNTNVPKSYKEQNSLGTWVFIQRNAFRESKMSKDRIDKLNSLEFVWEPFDTIWENYYNELVSYYNENGHSYVTMKTHGERNPLGHWSYVQRKAFKEGKLPEEKIKMLKLVNFVFEIPDKWEIMFLELKKYKKDNGNCLVPIDYKLQKNLGAWVLRQRTQFNKNSLSKERIDKLNSIGFIWLAREQHWENCFNELKKFKKENGHLNINSRYKGENNLGSWVVNQRALFKKEELSDEKIVRLNEIGFIWEFTRK